MYYILGIATGCTLAYFIGVKKDSVKGNLKEARGIFIATLLVCLYLCITLERGTKEAEADLRSYIEDSAYSSGYDDGYKEGYERGHEHGREDILDGECNHSYDSSW
jgi:hypothetical protein